MQVYELSNLTLNVIYIFLEVCHSQDIYITQQDEGLFSTYERFLKHNLPLSS